MTAQISDRARYRNEDYCIAGISGVGVFDPTEHGLQPVANCSACWRGFVCLYSIDANQLRLEELRINLGKKEHLNLRYKHVSPELFGVKPQKPTTDRSFFNTIFVGLEHKISYTGGLLLGRDFIDNFYVHMGFHPAGKYRTVHEVVFKEGKVVSSSDRSLQIAEFRKEMAESSLEPESGATRNEIKQWIAKCFSQNYRFLR